jgi:serine/threonine protein kinase
MSRKVIGEGSYGCVHKPSLECDENIGLSYDNYVSKLMHTQDARDELKEFLVIGRLDDKNEYHLGTPILCTPKLDKTVITDIKKCKHINPTYVKKNPHHYSLLIIKYGGPDLDSFCTKYLNTYLSKKKKTKSKTFWLGVRNLFKGLLFFRNHNIVHNDLKPQNILFNMETGQLMYIDFGLMRTKEEIMKSSKESKNYLGIFHWSYPFDCGFMNKKHYDYFHGSDDKKNNIIQSFSQMIVTNKLENPHNLPIKNPNAFNLVFTYINPDLVQPTALTKYGYLNDFFDNFKLDVNYDVYLNNTIDSIDIYGLGFTLQFVLNEFYKRKAISEDFFVRCSRLFSTMYSFNPYTRELNIENLITNYDNILLEYGLLSIDEVIIPPKIIEEYKRELSKPPKTITPELSRYAILDPPLCAEGKERNPHTNRCVNKCKLGYERNNEFKCVKTRKVSLVPCAEGKERNPHTNRCVNKCKLGYERNDEFKCVKTRKVSLVPCAEGKERNPHTNRCVNKCKLGYERNDEFKCVKIKK